MTLTLPWPPSVNTYWRRVGNRTLLSAKARAYRGAVAAACLQQRSPKLGSARLAVTVIAHPPDKRQRDLDNLPKGILDALSFAGVFDDDSQIDVLTVTRREVIKGGRVIVTVSVIQ